MELLPSSGAVEVTYLTTSGVGKKIVHLSSVRPVLIDDFQWHAKSFWTFSDRNIDLEMVYENIPENETWFFEWNGKWNEEGVNHEAFSIEKNYNERSYLPRNNVSID